MEICFPRLDCPQLSRTATTVNYTQEEMTSQQSDAIYSALDSFHIELPSWGFANTGTRFGKFQQAAAATNTEEKFADAGQVHQLTGACPTVALHVLWDFPNGVDSIPQVNAFGNKYGARSSWNRASRAATPSSPVRWHACSR